MSTRANIAVLFGLIVALMVLLMNYSAGTGPLEKHPLNLEVTKVLIILDTIGIAAALLVLASWKDISGKRRVELSGEEGLLVRSLLVLFGIGLLYLSTRGRSGIPRVNFTPINNTALTNTNGSPINYTPIQATHFENLTGSGPTFGIPSGYLFYLGAALVAAGFLYFGVVYYRDALKKRKRKEMRERALKFDRKVEGLGLEAFSDPREAVVGIYKNAVLWLEVLGIPYKESWTHWEHVRHVSLFKETFSGLTRLFEKAKYAPERVTWDDAKKALELYRKMRGVIDEGE
ncbi:DUF4129 domain-containing protein [Thermococcus sp.]